MRKYFYIGYATSTFLTMKQPTASKCILSTQAREHMNRNLKAAAERKSIWENTVPNVMASREIRTVEDWKTIRSALLESGKQITPVTIDSTILSYCIGSQNYDLGSSYMEFLKHENLKPSLAALGKYFKLFYLINNSKSLKETDVIDVLNMYNDLRKTYKVFDASTCESIIQALSLTNHWKEALKLLDEIKIACDPSTAAYSVIAAAAFKNNEYELAWKLLEEATSKNRLPLSVGYLSYLKQCERSPTADNINMLEKLFEFFQLHDIKCDVEVAKKIFDIGGKMKVRASSTIITKRGICQTCQQKLQKLELNEKEFEDLKNAVLKNVIVGKNVFCRTTPDELKRFQAFITNMRKYDVVIDGLNVAYSTGTRQSAYILSSLLQAVVKHFADQNKSILVLGRTHMEKWPKANWLYIKEKADTFLAQTLSQDDPYLLYCALHCGLNTIIVSRDLMRSHLFKLNDPKLKLLFNHWLTLSQYQLQFINSGKVFFKYPPLYSRTAQKVLNSWHIPYDEQVEDKSNNSNSSSSTIIEKWLCVNI